MEAIVTQGARWQDDKNTWTQFTLFSAIQETAFLPYEEVPNTTYVFKNFNGKEPKRHYFIHAVIASLFRICVTGHVGRPCLRLEFLGCIHRNGKWIT